MDLGKTWDGLPGWAKGAIAVGGLGVTGLVGFSIYNGIKRQIAIGKERQTGKEIDKAISGAKAAGKPAPTISQAMLSTMADELKTAFGTVTDESTIYRVLDQCMNDADLLMLIKTYDIREIPTSIPLASSFKGTLPEAVSNYVPQSSVWRKSVNDINDELKKKGITAIAF